MHGLCIALNTSPDVRSLRMVGVRLCRGVKYPIIAHASPRAFSLDGCCRSPRVPEMFLWYNVIRAVLSRAERRKAC